MVEQTAYDAAARKARYGRKDWIVWRDRAGKDHAAPCTAGAIKTALLAVGTRGRFTRLSAGTATGSVVRWPVGLVMLRNCRKGFDGPAVRH